MTAYKHPARILVIEDNPADVFLLRHALDENLDEYRLEVLRDGAEAMQFVRDQRKISDELHPCAIVMDIHLPKHDGPAVLQAIREEPTLAHIEVVALTGLINPKEEIEVRSLGVRLYKTKPTDLDEWIKLAGEILAICREKETVTI
jgi:CheY-like chemotaxis protein